MGLIYTRTGRAFFDGADTTVGQNILTRLQAVLSRSDFWERFATGWVCLDCELLPWSAKAGPLLIAQYAPVGHAGYKALAEAQRAMQAVVAQQKNLEAASGKDVDMTAASALYQTRQDCLERYAAAYRRYCRPVHSMEDYRIAPFHILATEGKVWSDETHMRHLENIKSFLTSDPLFTATKKQVVELGDESSVLSAVDWWMELTAAGGEGMVVKPMDFIVQGKKRPVQPAVKCRGQEYLRIIYGPEYTLPQHMERLKQRSLEVKRRLALREFALGMESLERFVRKEPLYRVQECVFGVLALESEPVDPRL
jgi:protein phosphatase